MHANVLKVSPQVLGVFEEPNLSDFGALNAALGYEYG
jgi:hypothetical protein